MSEGQQKTTIEELNPNSPLKQVSRPGCEIIHTPDCRVYRACPARISLDLNTMTEKSLAEANPNAAVEQLTDLNVAVTEAARIGCQIITTPDGRVYRVCPAKISPEVQSLIDGLRSK